MQFFDFLKIEWIRPFLLILLVFCRTYYLYTVGQKTDARNCKIPVLQLVVYGYCTKLSQTLIVCTSLERAFIRRLSDMGNDYWWNLRLLKGIL